MGLLKLGPNFEVEEWVEERDRVELIYEPLLMDTLSLSHLFFHSAHLHITHLHTVLKPFFPPELLLGLVVDSFPKVNEVCSLLTTAYKLLEAFPTNYLLNLQGIAFLGEAHSTINWFLNSVHHVKQAMASNPALPNFDDQTTYFEALLGSTQINIGMNYFQFSLNLERSSIPLVDWPDFLLVSELMECKTMIKKGILHLEGLELLGEIEMVKQRFSQYKQIGREVVLMIEENSHVFRNLLEEHLKLVRGNESEFKKKRRKKKKNKKKEQEEKKN